MGGALSSKEKGFSSVNATSAMPIFGRVELPVKMRSSVFLVRRFDGDCSPSAQRMASAMLDLPQPLGPTMAVMPSWNEKWVGLAKVLKP